LTVKTTRGNGTKVALMWASQERILRITGKKNPIGEEGGDLKKLLLERGSGRERKKLAASDKQEKKKKKRDPQVNEL